jgi:hypothetical protein
MLIPNAVLNFLSLRNASQITTVFVHHSNANPTLDIAELAAMEQANPDQAFETIGYNAYCKCIDVVNDIWVMQQGRPLNRVPAAQYGMNTQGYAICIGGNYQVKAAPFLTVVSDHALKVVAAQILLVKAKCPNLKYLQGHGDVKLLEMKQNILLTDAQASANYGTACPGTDLHDRLNDLRKMTGLANALT